MSPYINAVARLAAVVYGQDDVIVKSLRTCGHHMVADMIERRVADYRNADDALRSEQAECRRTVLSEAIEINGRLTP